MKSQIALYANPDPRIKTFYELIDFALDHGITCVEGYTHLGLEEPDVEEARRIREYADKKGVTFCCFSVGAYVAGPERHQDVERLKKFTDVAHILGSPFIHHTITPGFEPIKHTQEEIDATFNEAVESIREIADYAAALGMRAIYEDQAFLFNGIKGMERLFEVVDRDIGIVADFGNISQVDEIIPPFIERFHDKIAHVHVKDIIFTDDTSAIGTHPTQGGTNMCESIEFGTGDAEVEKAIGLLKKYGYSGKYSMEYWYHVENDPLVDIHLNRVNAWLDA